MAKTKEQKKESVKLLSGLFSKTKSVVFTNFDGLKVNDTNELRNILRENNVEYTVAKKTLLKLALKEAGMKDVDVDKMTSGLGVAFGIKDEIMPAKVLAMFAKKHPELKLIGGIFENKFIDANKVAELAEIPGREELFTKLVWLFNYPVSGLVNVLAGNLRSLVYALKAIQEKKFNLIR